VKADEAIFLKWLDQQEHQGRKKSDVGKHAHKPVIKRWCFVRYRRRSGNISTTIWAENRVVWHLRTALGTGNRHHPSSRPSKVRQIGRLVGHCLSCGNFHKPVEGVTSHRRTVLAAVSRSFHMITSCSKMLLEWSVFPPPSFQVIVLPAEDR